MPPNGKKQNNPKTPEPVRVSFLPEEPVQKSTSGTRLQRWALIFLLAEIVVLGGLTLILRMPALSAKKEIVRLTQQLAQNETQLKSSEGGSADLVRLTVGLREGKRLLDRHKAWEKLFRALEENTLPEIAYQSIAVDAKGVAVLSAKSKTWHVLGDQLRLWRSSPAVKSVQISGASLGVDPKGGVSGVQATFTVTFTPETLQWKP